MTTSYIDDALLTAIADAIIAKGGSSVQMTPAEMATAIANIPSGGGSDYLAEHLNKTLVTYRSTAVTKLRPYAFYCPSTGFDQLQSIDLPNAETNSNSDSTNAFAYCSSLQSVNLPKFTQVGDNMFRSCTALQNVTLGTLLGIGTNTFYGCSALSAITANFGSMTAIGQSAFYGSGITSMNCPECTSLGAQAFYNCGNLTSVLFPKVTSLARQTFYDCKKLATVDFTKVTSILSRALYACKLLTTLALPACTTFGESNSQNSPIDACSGLTELHLGENTVTIYTGTASGKAVFNGCSALERVIIDATAPPTLTAAPIYGTGSTVPVAGRVPPNFDAFYVPDASVSAYQTASNWATYASYIKPMSLLPS